MRFRAVGSRFGCALADIEPVEGAHVEVEGLLDAAGVAAFAVHVDEHVVAFEQLAAHHLLCDTVNYLPLDEALKRAGAKDGVVAVDGQRLARSRRDIERHVALREARAHLFELQLHNGLDVADAQSLERNDVVDAVQELGTERGAQGLVDGALLGLLVAVFRKFANELGSHVARHDDDGVLEVHHATLPIGETPVVEHLQQDIEHVGMGLLDLIEQNHAVRTPTNGFGELATLVVAHVARRRADEPLHAELLHVLGHIDADHGFLAVEQVRGERLGELGLAHTRGAEEQEAADGPVGVGQPRTVAANGPRDRVDSRILPDDALMKLHFEVGELLQALTVDSRRSVAVDLAQPDLVPSAWVRTPSPVVVNDSARAIYELHLRDFSAEDRSVPEALRGTYRAFTVDSAGTRHLRELAAAGMDTIHLLPTFDNATIPEERSAQRIPRIPLDTSPASRRPQAAISAVADVDAYNWGYDPYHWAAPEGSYATEGNQDGGARCAEFRQMVGALHEIGLQVVLDQVFNHTAAAGQDKRSVLDRIVPGYYHRLNAAGTIEDSAFGANTATEHLMTERLMIDACVSWVRHYRVDGLRFDLMGYHSVDTMRRLRSALDALTVGADGVDGSLVFLYGEGWNMGEVADNALFTQAVQGQLGGTGIATFNDRLRDGVRGGSTVDADMRAAQGFGTGELTDPSPFDERREGELRLDLAWRRRQIGRASCRERV